MIAQIDTNYLRYGPGRLSRRLASYAFYEGRPLTTRGRWINPLVFAWLRLQASLPGHPSVKAPIFVVGLGRSGTTILGVLLSLHREISFLNEPKALWHVIDPRQDINGNYSMSGGLYRMSASDANSQLRLRAHRLYSRYLALTGGRRVLDKYPELVFRIPYVLKLFPDAQFIFITRNGIDAVPSVVRWSQQQGIRSSEHIDDWWGRDDQKWSYLCEQVVLPDPQYQSIWPLATPALDHTNRAAIEWIVTMREGLARHREFPASIIRVSYEELIASPKTVLEHLQAFCGLDLDPAVVAYAKGRLYENPPRTKPTMHSAVEELFDATTHALGHARVSR